MKVGKTLSTWVRTNLPQGGFFTKENGGIDVGAKKPSF